MTLAQRFFYRLGFNQARWFRRWVGGKWVRHRIWGGGAASPMYLIFLWRQSDGDHDDDVLDIDVEDYRTLPTARLLDN